MSLAVILKRVLLVFLIVIMPLSSALHASDTDMEAMFDDDFGEKQEVVVYDPLESINRVFFIFNDRLYFWILKPVGKVYTGILGDEAVRGCISAVFHNILAPVRALNSLLQGKFKQSGTEVARFAINTVFGAGGLGDPAATEFGLTKADEDLGQTLGFYGVGEGIYICWPLLGPSSARDTLGMAGDYFLNPLTYIFAGDWASNAGLTALKTENAATLNGKDYEGLVKDAFDPYISLRDIYYQYRRNVITTTPSSGDQNQVSGGDIGFSQEQCPELHGNGLFRNLAGARKYQQCLKNTGGHASVNRTQKKGRALYLVILDDQM